MFYGWRMVGLVSAIRILGGGLHNYGFTVFFLPLSQDLGLSRAATSLAFSLAIEGPFVGYLIDRFGPRPMILVATIACGLGYILLSTVDSYSMFLVVYLGIISLSFTLSNGQSMSSSSRVRSSSATYCHRPSSHTRRVVY